MIMTRFEKIGKASKVELGIVALRVATNWAAATVVTLCATTLSADEHKLDAHQSTELAAVTSPRQAGSREFEPGQSEEAKPLTFEVAYKADLLAGLSGAWRDKGAYLGNIDLKFTIAGEHALKLPGSTLFFHVLNNHGGKPNERVGATQGIDNIEVEINTTKLLQAWYQQQWLDDKLSLLLGLYDVNSEFYVTDNSALFIHPSFGIGAELAQTGENGPSIFPTTSIGLRARWQMAAAWYAQAVVLDGVPGDKHDAHGTQVRFDQGDGTLWIVEIGRSETSASESLKAAFGFWQYSQRSDDLRDTDVNGDPAQRSNAGAYALAEKTLYRSVADPQRRLDGFVRFGTADADVNQLDFSIALGATYAGFVPNRPEDMIGFGVAAAKNGGKFRQIARAMGEPAPRWEIGWELSYRAQLKPWLALQPMLQYVSYVGDAAAREATVAGLRIEASF